MKIAIPGVLILIGVVGLIAMGISQGAIPEVNVESLQNGDYDGQQVRLLGVIHKIETDTRPMRFEIRGMQDPSVVVMAQVDDQRPDLFKVDTDVAVIRGAREVIGEDAYIVGDVNFGYRREESDESVAGIIEAMKKLQGESQEQD